MPAKHGNIPNDYAKAHKDPHLQIFLQLPHGMRISLETLRAFEDRLEEQLGAAGQVMAHLSTGGVRTMHVYVDSTADLLTRVKGLARGWPEGRATVHDMPDPGWQAAAHLRQ